MARGDTVEQVRWAAERFGVSERTVYRWFKRMAEEGTTDLLDRLEYAWVCDYCGDPLPDTGTVRLRYHPACRQAAYRARKEHTRRRRWAEPGSSPHHHLPSGEPHAAARTTPGSAA